MCLGLGQDFTGEMEPLVAFIAANHFLVIVVWHATDTIQFDKFHHIVELREDAWGRSPWEGIKTSVV